MKKIAILGATSHIAKGLICNYLKTTGNILFLFARSIDRLAYFLNTNGFNITNIYQVDRFFEFEYDIIINCIGFADPKKQQSAGYEIFLTTEYFDNLILKYLSLHRSALYINFSSGAVYGSTFDLPATENTFSRIDINNIDKKDYYRIAKINSEIKHRAFGKDNNIVDLRIFSYFSRFIDLDSSFLISEIIRCCLEKRKFATNSVNILRDFIHPDDLFRLIELVSTQKEINTFFDVYSIKPVSKFEIIEYFKSYYGLDVVVNENTSIINTTGIKDNYYSLYKKAETIGFKPQYSSIDTIKLEASELLSKK
jgi:nucleoside-diphosphate-sugar epimerase